MTRTKRLSESNLIIIDDLMFMAMDNREANLYFLINNLYVKSLIIITSNKSPTQTSHLS
ncbi:ATP-binding protein [Evansella clarkii]|uniref:ATP-binding protein n=1 Tax=Evansella clarkii TaxID=79879 RepID=UPI000B454755